jgi:hypothetical protein
MSPEEMRHLRKQLRGCESDTLKVLLRCIDCFTSNAWDYETAEVDTARQLRSVIANADIDVRRKEIGKMRLKGTIVPAFPVISS